MRIRFANLAGKFGQLAAVLGFCLLSISSQQPASASGVAREGSARTVRIGVLGLFHPRELRITPIAGQALLLQAGSRSIVLEKSSGVDSAAVQLSPAGIAVTSHNSTLRASVIAVGGRNGEPIDFVLAIPGKITRRYHGTLEIKTDSESLIPTVSMDLEIAVASVVAAESAPDTPVEALKAQAIATRSYFVSGRGRHRDFDFCDTTHCQFLREPSPAGSKVMQAVIETRQMILAYNSKPFAAMYTRSCAGRTRTPAQLGLSPVSYPYYSVDCPFCRSHPARWTTRISLADAAALRSSDESSRLNLGRLLGWNAVPSNDFVLKLDGNEVILQGTGNGHGIGLCQSGSKAMAEAGSNFREILAHYYPNATVIILPGADSAGAYAGF